MDEQRERVGYVVPSYRAPDDTAWYHFLHGNVPGHQIDFIYRPEIPQGPLTPQHYSHLSRLMKYIEPQTNGLFAFAIGNLSRDDTQYEPAHGGVALIFGLRIRGMTDHAGRQDPPFAHAIAAIDRELTAEALLASAEVFHRHVLGAAEAGAAYREYAEHAQEDLSRVSDVIERYVTPFADLPQPAVSTLAAAWVTLGAAQPRRIVIAHDDNASFPVIAAAAAQISAILYRSDIRWTVLSNGREDDVPNGVSIRFLPRSNLSAADAAGSLHELADLPEDDRGMAELLFSAVPVETGEKPAATGWRRQAAVEASAPEESARRQSWDAPAPRWRRRDPVSGDDISVDIEMDAEGTDTRAVVTPAAAARDSAKPSVRPPSAKKGWSEPPTGDRAAVMEIPIPAAPKLPEVVAPKLEIAPAPPTERALRRSSTKVWLVLVACAAAGILLFFYLEARSPTGGSSDSPSSAVSAAPSAAPMARALSQTPSATTSSPPAAPTTAAVVEPTTAPMASSVLRAPPKDVSHVVKPEATGASTHRPSAVAEKPAPPPPLPKPPPTRSLDDVLDAPLH
ncbi:MAG: hypothetical protein ABJE95_10645 [Byssovorax sp.]